jgi:hypothetical protein
LVSSLLPFLTDGDLQNTQKTQQAVDFSFFPFLFTDLFTSIWICFSLGFAFFSVSGGWLANGFLSTAVQLLVAGSGLLGERDGVCERMKGRCNKGGGK